MGLTSGRSLHRRQLVALTTFSDLVGEARERARQDAVAAGMADDGLGLDAEGNGATAMGMRSLCSGVRSRTFCRLLVLTGPLEHATATLSNMFSRQAIPMVWDFPEANPFSGKGGSLDNLFDWTVQSIPNIGGWSQGRHPNRRETRSCLRQRWFLLTRPLRQYRLCGSIRFLGVWLRRVLRQVFPCSLPTLATPKAEELVATPYRHGNKERVKFSSLRA